MAIKNATFLTFTCNGPSCANTITFEQKDAQEAYKETAFLKTGRVVQTADQRGFWYCSDQCEIAGIADNLHNPQEEKKLVSIDGAGTAAIRAAAEQAARAEAASKALKAGAPVSIPVSQ